MKTFLAAIMILLSTSALQAGVAEDPEVPALTPTDNPAVVTKPGVEEGSEESVSEENLEDEETDNETLSDDVDDVRNYDNEKAGIGLMTWILVLIVGAAGGFAGGMLAVAKSRRDSYVPAEPEPQAQPRQRTTAAATSHRPAPAADNGPSPRKNPEPEKKPEKKEEEPAVVTPPVIADDEVIVEPVVTPDPEPAAPTVRRAFANFLIPQAGTIIARHKFISDQYTDQLFELNLNEKTGTGTYTVAPGRMGDIVSNLGTLEKFVDKFEFKPESTRIEIVSQGKLTKTDSYWQVTELLKINMI